MSKDRIDLGHKSPREGLNAILPTCVATNGQGKIDVAKLAEYSSQQDVCCMQRATCLSEGRLWQWPITTQPGKTALHASTRVADGLALILCRQSSPATTLSRLGSRLLVWAVLQRHGWAPGRLFARWPPGTRNTLLVAGLVRP